MKALSCNVKGDLLISNGLALGVSLVLPLGLTLRQNSQKGIQGNDRQLSDNWPQQFSDNLSRGCTRASLVEAMVRENFEPVFAVQCV